MPSTLSAADLVASRFRQIHLDFHTSPLIPDVGSEFDANTFADTLVDAHVNWVTLFAKCHHGMSYYPTRAGITHPGLKFDLLGAQIEACKRRGIATPVYISVRVDQHIGMTEPGWVARLEDGKLWGPSASQAGWYNLCMNNPDYVDYLAAQTEEVLRDYDADGIFYDMCYFPPDPGCFCERCLARLEKSGHSRHDREAHRAQTFEITRAYTTLLAKLCREIRPNATVFFNGRTELNIHRELDVFTHLEIESLATGGWGYLYFPCWSRLVRTYPRPLQGMTARFHKSWADFGGIKTVPQLNYEAGTILAAGAVMNVGDQLHPRGTLDRGAYAVIGETFRKVEAAEPWCRGAEALADVALLALPQPTRGPAGESGAITVGTISPSIEGAAAVFATLKQQWNGETPDRDNLSKYKVIVLPDYGVVDEEMEERLRQFQSHGGAILFSHEAGLRDGKFVVPGSPARYDGPCPWTPSYMRLGDKLGAGLPDSELVNYREGSYVTAEDGAEALGEVWQPYFNRAPEHFSSHNQTPADKPTGHPIAVVAADTRTAYAYAAMFKGYRDDAFYIYAEVISRLLARLLPEPLVRPLANVPAAMEISVLRQAEEQRVVAHLVHFQPQRRTSGNEYIEAETPLCDVSFAVRTGARPSRVSLAPEGTNLEFEQNGAYCHVTVPRMITHQMVAFDGLPLAG